MINSSWQPGTSPPKNAREVIVMIDNHREEMFFAKWDKSEKRFISRFDHTIYEKPEDLKWHNIP